MESFWIYIIIDIVLIIGVLGFWLYNNFFDTRAIIFFIYPDRQIKMFKVKIVKDTITYYGKPEQTYTVNNNMLLFNRRRPYLFYYYGNPIACNILEQIEDKLTPDEVKFIKKLNTKHNKQFALEEPTKWMNEKKTVSFDSAETLFRILNTNFTMNLIKPPNDFKQAIKWTVILIAVGIFIAVILHFTGVIDIFELLGTAPPKK